MTRSPQRPAFSIVCACGAVIHSGDEHLGRTIKCRCGRSVVIARPVEKETVVGGRSERKSTRRSRKRATVDLSGLLARVPRMPRLQWPVVDVSEWSSRRATTRWTFRAAVMYTAAMVATWIALFTVSEFWLPATLLAYGPRWVVLLPLVVLLPMALLFARTSVKLLAVGALVAIMPIMGFRVAVPTAGFTPPAAPGAEHIRVLSLNAQGGAIVKLRLAGILERYAPSIVAMQECGDELAATVATA